MQTEANRGNRPLLKKQKPYFVERERKADQCQVHPRPCIISNLYHSISKLLFSS